MANKFSRLRGQMSPEARKQAEKKAQEMLALHELRQARGLTQNRLAE